MDFKDVTGALYSQSYCEPRIQVEHFKTGLHHMLKLCHTSAQNVLNLKHAHKGKLFLEIRSFYWLYFHVDHRC